MKSLALLVAASLAAGCTGDDDGGNGLPVVTQVQNPTTSVGGRLLFGRVCIVSDLRQIVACSTRDLDGLRVVIGANATFTAADGTFSIPAPTVDETPTTSVFTRTVTVSGATAGGVTIVPTTVPLISDQVVVPAVDASVFGQMVAANGVDLLPDTGSILTQVTSQAGVPVAGVAVTSNPTSAFGPFFDAGSPVTWGIGRTGALGMVWVPAVTVGSVDLSFQSQLGGIETTINGIQVHNGGITVLDATLPIP